MGIVSLSVTSLLALDTEIGSPNAAVSLDTRYLPAPHLVFQGEINFNAVDSGTPVDDEDYQVPFAFTGKIKKLTIEPKSDRERGTQGS